MKREPTKEELNSQKRIKFLIAEYCDGSQQVFADRAGIGKSSVSQYVKGTNFPSNQRAAQIAQAFQVLPMWVMGFDVPMKSEIPSTGGSLNKDEQALLSTYRSLSEPGKKRVRNYASSVLDLENQEQELYAAHHREGVTDISDHDKAIMEDDSEWE